jgi:hypothetical protein
MSGAPESCLACAAANARCARRPGSGVSCAASSRQAAAAAHLRAAGGLLELGGHDLVRLGCRKRAVPRPAVGVAVWIGHVRQRLMDGSAVFRRCRAIGR